ncbi:hypothetical protein POM88_034769 [Heracleum sosnowskyi]|uniref:Uncharacterized protein n=1 Tax=Heracleum sosnowskyi TaxID=360622 RepID=A0AAD8HJX1_9APIA|nr:hypothetical protein POM88_034769 [Heracleum sosnowskyi]
MAGGTSVYPPPITSTNKVNLRDYIYEGFFSVVNMRVSLALEFALLRHMSWLSTIEAVECSSGILGWLLRCLSLRRMSVSLRVTVRLLEILSLRLQTRTRVLHLLVVGDNQHFFLPMFHSAPNCREGVLYVLYALASTPELAWSAAKHGGVVYILELLLPLQEEIPLQQRAAAASLLGKLVGQPMHGPRVAITLARFFQMGLYL